jgi:hypothetical protein
MLASLTTLGSNACDAFGGNGLSVADLRTFNPYSTRNPKLFKRLEERKARNEFLRSYL